MKTKLTGKWVIALIAVTALGTLADCESRPSPTRADRTQSDFSPKPDAPSPAHEQTDKPEVETGISSGSAEQTAVADVSAPAYSAPVSEEGWCNLPYRPVDPAAPAGSDRPRPQMPFTIEYGPRSFSGVALVDSGADDVVFPLSYARALEVDLSKMPAGIVQGVGGSAVEYAATVTLHVTLCGREFHYPIKAHFSDAMEEIGLLGQIGFLDHFHVAFRKTEGIFAVELPSGLIVTPESKPERGLIVDSKISSELWSEVQSWVAADRSGDLGRFRTFYNDLLTRYYNRTNVNADEVIRTISEGQGYTDREITASNPSFQALDSQDIQIDYDKVYRFSGPNMRLNQGKVKATLRLRRGATGWKITSEFDRETCWSTLMKDPFLQSPPGTCPM